MASRMERGPLADWWWTVDRALLVMFVMLMLFGILVSLAGSPPVAERLNYGTFHFVIRQMIFLVPAVIILVVTSFLSPRYVRRLALLVYVGAMALVVYALIYGVEIKGARRWINLPEWRCNRRNSRSRLSLFLSRGRSRREGGVPMFRGILSGFFCWQ